MSPPPSEPPVRVLRFGVFEVDLKSGELRRRGVRVRLHHKPFQVLTALLERPGELVTRDELRRRLWPDREFGDFDNNLNAAVRKLRRALGDSARSPRFVETLPRRGYRFLAPVEAVRPGGETPTPGPARRRLVVATAVGLLMAAGVVAAVLLALPGGWWAGGAAPPRSDGAALRLAVLPFDNLTGDPGRDYFSDGLTEELITHLGRLQPERLAVIARISSMSYRGSDKSVPEIGRELDVGYLLRGSIRASGERWRVTARLVEVTGRSQMWAESWDVAPGDLLELQSDLAVRVAHALALELLPGERDALARAGTAETAAYEAYLRGRHAWNRFDADGYREAVEHYRTALDLDPDYAAAWAGLADAHNLRAFTADVLPAEAFPAARRAAQRALELDPRSAAAHNALAFGLLYGEYDPAAAERSFRSAVELEPNYAMAWHWRAGALAALERHDEAVAAARRALELDPVSLSVRSDLGWYLLYADRWQAGLEECRSTLEVSDYGWARGCVVQAHLGAGRPAEALAAYRRALAADGRPADALETDRVPPRRALARLHLRELERASRDDLLRRRYPLQLVFAAAGAGETDTAFRWLERAWELHDPWLVFLTVDPRFDPLHDDPRFPAWVERVAGAAAK